MTCESSVSDWLSSLKRGGAEATQRIWERYYEQLVRVAHRKLGQRPRRAADEEDVVQEVFASFFSAVKSGRFPRLDDRDDLWQVFLVLADRRAADLMRKELADIRGGGDVRGDSAFINVGQSSSANEGMGRVEGREPTPETISELIDLFRSRWEILQDETLSRIALEKFQGFQNREIAERNELSLRAVERKLRLIRRLMTEES